MKCLDIKDFRAELLIHEFKSSDPDVILIQQVFFWMKTSILIKFQEETKVIENFASFANSCFQFVTFTGFDVISSKLLKTVWKVNFINDNYKFIESKVRLEKEKNQHWLVMVISLLQKSYHYLLKAYYDYFDDYEDLFDRFDRFLAASENTEALQSIWTPKIESKREKFELKSIFSIKKEHLVQALITTITNILNSPYFQTHPRRFAVEYINSLSILLSIKSKKLFEFTGEWVNKNLSALSLTSQFPDIFRVIVLLRATYRIRKNDYESATLNMMDFLSAQNGMSQEDYKKAIEVSSLLAVVFNVQRESRFFPSTLKPLCPRSSSLMSASREAGSR